MTEAAGRSSDDTRDVQRPLDESVPVPRTAATLTTPGGAPPEAATASPTTLDIEPDATTSPDTGPGATTSPDTEPDATTLVTEPEAGATLRPAVPADPDPAEPAGPRGPVAAALAGVARSAAWLARLPRRTVRAVAAWSRRPSGRFAVPGAVTAALVAATVSGGAFLVPAAVVTSAGQTPSPPVTVPTGVPDGVSNPTAPSPAPPVGLPTTPAGPVANQRPPEVLSGWAAQMSAQTGIPVVAVQAYGYAELVVTRTTPACRLSWTTLAAIGRVESNHGSSNSATLLPDGRALPRITGLPLDGQGGRDLINDTDRGVLDGDVTYDRAVGPMQFIPSTWQQSGVDASGDGFADINNVNDAALSAANYLCAGGRDLSTPDDWWAAILSYNNVQSYAEEVFGQANEYGRRSRGAAG